MKVFLLLAILLSSFATASEDICSKIGGASEGNWPIPESAFTEQAAEKSLAILKQFVSNGTYGLDSVSIDKELIIIRGYLLKSRVSTNMPGTKQEFCNFIRKEAYVQH